MARKSTSGKALTADELVGIVSDTIRNVKNGTMKNSDANTIASSVRTICQVVKTQMQAAKYAQTNGVAPSKQLLK